MVRRHSPGSAWRAVPAIGALLCLTIVPARGQDVRGVVVEASSGHVVEGAFVSLIDVQDRAVASSLTGPEGAFQLSARARGTYRLRVERIGYASWLSEPFETGPGDGVSHRLAIPVRPVRLRELPVRVESACAGRSEGGYGLARAWEEARKALELTRWTERETGVRFELERWVRTLDPETERVRREERRESETRSWRTFVSAPAETLSRDGYVRRDAHAGQAWRFFAPDADVLLSDVFADDHCFSLAEGRGDEEGLVGLAFEPVPGRRTPDVRGVLWLDEGGSGLRHLLFTYTNAGFERPLSQYQAGGRVEFARLRGGHWFVRRWHIRVPVAGERMGVRLGPDRALRPGRERLLAEVREIGGEVVRAMLPDGSAARVAAWGDIEGTVRDAAGGSAVAGVEVAVVGTAYEGRTDDLGRFRIGPIPPGDYTLSPREADAEILGLTLPEHPLTVRPWETVQVELSLPTLEARFDELCPAEDRVGPDGAEPGGTRTLTLFGVVREEASDRPVPAARVWIADREWATQGPPVAVEPAGPAVPWTGISIETDSAGVYVACHVPGDVALVAQAGAAEGASATTAVDTRPANLLRLDFEVTPEIRPLARFQVHRDVDLEALVDEILAAGGGEAGPATLVGTVRSAADGRPVAGARVRLLDRGDERVTGQDGAFVMTDLPRGRYRVVTEYLGTASDTVEVDLRRAAGQAAQFTLETRPVPLPMLEVEIERTWRNARLAGFYERMERGLGEFITREDLEARDVIHNIRRLPNVQIQQCLNQKTRLRMGDCWDIKISRGVGGSAFRGDRRCPPLLYVDGHLLPTRDVGESDVGSAGGQSPRAYGTNGFTLLQNMPRDILEGIEVYRSPAGAPAQYRALGDTCGIILVWTRGR